MVHAQPQPHTSGNHDRGAAYALARPLIDDDTSPPEKSVAPYRPGAANPPGLGQNWLLSDVLLDA
jgi:hypothetical protein